MNAIPRDFAQPLLWCILRTSNQNTLRLVRSLNAASLTAWTPTEERTIRVPRANIRRPVVFPLMPGYAFADAGSMVDLLELAREPAKRGHGFNVFRRHDGTPALVPNQLLAGMRELERKRTPVPASKLPKPGQSYRLTGLGFDGLRGVVIRCSQRYCTVAVEGFGKPLQVSPWLLSEAA